jgi:hypothetical protein
VEAEAVVTLVQMAEMVEVMQAAQVVVHLVTDNQEVYPIMFLHQHRDKEIMAILVELMLVAEAVVKVLQQLVVAVKMVVMAV